MDSIGTKTWATIGMAGVLLFVSYWVRFVNKQQMAGVGNQAFSYSMPRPRHYEPSLDLSGRPINRQYKTLGALPAHAAPAAKVIPLTKVDPKKVAADQAAALKKQKEAQAKAAKTKAAAAAAEARRKKLFVRAAEAGRTPSMAGFDNTASGPNAAAYGGVPVPPAPASTAEVTATAGGNADDTTTLSASQWRSLLQSAPTAANIARFIKAKKAGTISATAYYQIVGELLVDSAEDRKAAALSILDQDISAGSFVFMVTESSTVSADVLASLKTRLAAYGTVAHFSILVSVVSTANQAAAQETAMSLMSPLISAYRSAAGTTATSVSITAAQMSSSLAALKIAAKSSDQTVVSQANSLIASIQSAGVQAAERLAEARHMSVNFDRNYDSY